MRKLFSMALAVAVCTVATMETVKADALNVRSVPVGTGGLKAALDAITTAGPAWDVVAEQDPFALFTSTASGGSVATFIFEVSSFSGSNEFGIYDSVSGTKALIFTGADTAGEQKLVSFFANGDIAVNGTVVASGFASPENFGFYVDVYGLGDAGYDHTVFSEDSLNKGGEAQMLVFQGDNSRKLTLPGFSEGVFTPDEYIIAVEDLLLADGSDRSYDDLVVLIESISPVPAPGAVLLGAMGLSLVGWTRRRFS